MSAERFMVLPLIGPFSEVSQKSDCKLSVVPHILSKVAIVIPTIEGREAHLERCIAAYVATAPRARLYIQTGHGSCGAAWIAGAKEAGEGGFDYLHFSADDLEPHDGWLKVATETVDAGYIPAPLVFNPDGSLDSAGLQGFGQYRGAYEDWMLIEGTTVPFLTREMWEQVGMLPGFSDLMGRTHYCTDQLVSTAGRRCGWETAIREGMAFTHHTAQAGRNYGRVPADTGEFLKWAI